MHQIQVTLQNDLGTDYKVVHVYDEYGGPPMEVTGSPFPILSKQCSPVITVGADNRNNGVIGYSCDGGDPLDTASPCMLDKLFRCKVRNACGLPLDCVKRCQ